MKTYLPLLALMTVAVNAIAQPQGKPSLDENGIDAREPIYTFADSPATIVRGDKVSFTQPNGETHYYEAIELPNGGVNWSQAKALAEEAGGYLASITSKEENAFVFSLIDNDKFWYTWDDTHNGVKSGPFLGGFQSKEDDQSDNPKQGWQWVSGEPWSYENWAYDGMEGDRDPRPNTQPNDATGGQDVLAFGEVNDRVATWGDFPHKMSSYGDDKHPAKVHGFVIEYNSKPNK